MLGSRHDDVPDGRVPPEDLLHLLQLDAEAADLHLLVGPAEELDEPVAAPAHQVPVR
nr:hypothetical protein GCM10020093_034260 [Planobispora longispora]